MLAGCLTSMSVGVWIHWSRMVDWNGGMDSFNGFSSFVMTTQI